MPGSIQIPNVEFLAPITESYAEILTPEAVEFIVDLQRTFNARRKALLEARHERQKRLDAGEKPNFLAETKAIRDAEWSVAPLPNDILDRRVEITGPVDRKMIINALNSGAKVFMADFEDSNTPTWNNLLDGQINLRDAIRRTITFSDPATGKQYKLIDKIRLCCLCVRAAGTLKSGMCAWMASRCPARSSTLAFTSSTMRKSCWHAAAVPTFTCQKWRAISKRACGMTSLSARNRRLACRKAPSRARS